MAVIIFVVHILCCVGDLQLLYLLFALHTSKLLSMGIPIMASRSNIFLYNFITSVGDQVYLT